MRNMVGFFYPQKLSYIFRFVTLTPSLKKRLLAFKKVPILFGVLVTFFCL